VLALHIGNGAELIVRYRTKQAAGAQLAFLTGHLHWKIL